MNEIVEYQGLNSAQIAIITQSTPKEKIRQRKGRGGKIFDYLPHAEVAKMLNEAFNHAWSFETEVIECFCNDKEMTVKGRLVIHCPDGKTIVKEQYGSQDIMKDMPKGDALKGAASDALKKCASLLGIALDLYGNGFQWEEPLASKMQIYELEGLINTQMISGEYMLPENRRISALNWISPDRTFQEMALKITAMKAAVEKRLKAEAETQTAEVGAEILN